LKGSDISYHRHNRLDIALVKNLPIAIVFLPAADIPTFVGEGKVSLGITGRDQVLEHEAAFPSTDTTGVEEVLDLGFGKCKLQVQIPEKGDIQTPEGLVGRTVVTSFTNLTAKYFKELEEKAEGSCSKTTIKYVGGSVEAACALGVADGIVDLVGKLVYFCSHIIVVNSCNRIRRNHASSWPKSNLNSSRILCRAHPVQTPI